MGLVDAEREYLIAKRRSLRGGIKMWIFVMALNVIALIFAHRMGDMFFYWLNGIMLIILGINVIMAKDQIDKITYKLENEE